MISNETNTEKFNKRRKIDWITLFIICLIFVIIMPVIIASRYTFYHADDFSHANAVGVFDGNIVKLLIASLRFTKRMYFVWQGTYTSMFLQSFLSPLNGLGNTQLCIVMLINIMLFIVSLKIFLDSIYRSLNIYNNICNLWVVFSLCIVGIFGFTGWTEVFYWFSGAVSYSFPMSFCLIGIAITLQSKSVAGYIGGAVLMFLASGGTLEVAGTGCVILLGICIVKKMTGSAKIKDYVIFGISFIGALINTAAPGNYVRHTVIDDTGLHLGTALLSTVLEVVNSLEELMINTPIILIIIIAIIMGANIGRDRKKNIKVLSTSVLFCVATPFVTCFPVCLAYSGGMYFPNRCKFIETTVLVMVMILISSIIGYVCSEQINSLHKKETFIFLVMFSIVMSNINPSWKISQLVPWHMWDEIAYGSYKKYHDEVNKIYDFISSDNNENVFIYEKPEDIEEFSIVNLSEDMSDWINTAIAQYYHKKSVQYVSDPLAVQSDGQKNIRISPDTFDGKIGYASIFKIDGVTQTTEALQVLQPLDSNMVISMQKDETGRVAIYLFADNEGKTQIDEVDIEY